MEQRIGIADTSGGCRGTPEYDTCDEREADEVRIVNDYEIRFRKLTSEKTANTGEWFGNLEVPFVALLLLILIINVKY